jgi:hypothetical protein
MESSNLSEVVVPSMLNNEHSEDPIPSSPIKEHTYMRKVSKEKKKFKKFVDKALTHYEAFVGAIVSGKLEMDMCCFSLKSLLLHLLKAENIHELFTFINDHKDEVDLQATHTTFPIWEKYDVYIQYMLDKEDTCEYGRLCLVSSAHFLEGFVQLFRQTCANCKTIERPVATNTKEGGIERFRKCGRCKKVYYCSVDCQKKHWKIHKVDCNESN